MVRERALERHDEIPRVAPLLSYALPLIGHPAIRSRGTIGGSMAHADPAAELPAVAVALDAELVAQSRQRGRRSIAAGDFFTGFLSTALEPDEILTEVRIPRPVATTGSAFEEVARRHGDFAMVGAAAVIRLDAGRIAGARVVLTGVSDAPLRLTAVESVVNGVEPADEVFADAADQVTRTLEPPADVHGSSAYRRHLAGVLIKRTLGTASARAAA
jgi:carbon-monoxide dehydrogenase medium subunit